MANKKGYGTSSSNSGGQSSNAVTRIGESGGIGNT